MSYLTAFKDIPLESYLRLRKESGLGAKTEEAGKIGLKNSICSVLVSDPESGNAHIGMGRIIGDGGCHCQVTDICVLPEYQGKGLGKAIMEKLMEFRFQGYHAGIERHVLQEITLLNQQEHLPRPQH